VKEKECFFPRGSGLMTCFGRMVISLGLGNVKEDAQLALLWELLIH